MSGSIYKYQCESTCTVSPEEADQMLRKPVVVVPAHIRHNPQLIKNFFERQKYALLAFLEPRDLENVKTQIKTNFAFKVLALHNSEHLKEQCKETTQTRVKGVPVTKIFK